MSSSNFTKYQWIIERRLTCEKIFHSGFSYDDPISASLAGEASIPDIVRDFGGRQHNYYVVVRTFQRMLADRENRLDSARTK